MGIFTFNLKSSEKAIFNKLNNSKQALNGLFTVIFIRLSSYTKIYYNDFGNNNCRIKKQNEKLLKEYDIRNNWEELNVLEQKVLQYIYDKGEVTNKEICEYIDRTRRTTIRILNRLEEKIL